MLRTCATFDLFRHLTFVKWMKLWLISFKLNYNFHKLRTFISNHKIVLFLNFKVSGVYKTSCKTGAGVEEMFSDIANQLAEANRWVVTGLFPEPTMPSLFYCSWMIRTLVPSIGESLVVGVLEIFNIFLQILAMGSLRLFNLS